MYAAVELGPGRAQVSLGSARFCESTDSAAAIPPVQSQPSRSSSRSQAVKVKETLVGDWRSMMVVVAKRLWREQRAALFVNQQSFRGGFSLLYSGCHRSTSYPARVKARHRWRSTYDLLALLLPRALASTTLRPSFPYLPAPLGHHLSQSEWPWHSSLHLLLDQSHHRRRPKAR